MEKLTISVQTREEKEKFKKEKYIPGVVYGAKSKNIMIKLDKKEFKKVFDQAGESTLVDLIVGDKEIGKIVINDYQVDPVSGSIIHVDLYRVRMDKKIVANIPIVFDGEAPAVKNEGGVLVKNSDKIEIKCLPKDLIHDIKIDLSVLENIDDIIRVKDLEISKDIEIIADFEEVIALIAPPRVVEQEESLETEEEKGVESVKDVKEKEGEDSQESETDEEVKKGEK